MFAPSFAKTENDALEQLSGQIRSARPTTERMLKTFMYITLTIVQTEDTVIRHLTPLYPTQQRILQPLGLPPDTYLKIENVNLKTHHSSLFIIFEVFMQFLGTSFLSRLSDMLFIRRAALTAAAGEWFFSPNICADAERSFAFCAPIVF